MQHWIHTFLTNKQHTFFHIITHHLYSHSKDSLDSLEHWQLLPSRDDTLLTVPVSLTSLAPWFRILNFFLLYILREVQRLLLKEIDRQMFCTWVKHKYQYLLVLKSLYSERFTGKWEFLLATPLPSSWHVYFDNNCKAHLDFP